MRKLALLGSVLALALAAAAQAGAAGPTIQTIPFSLIQNFTTSAECGLPITVLGHGELRVMTFPDRTLLIFPGTAYTTISANGKTVTTLNSGNTVIGTDGSYSGAGIAVLVTVPGEGVVFRLVGRLAIDAAGNVSATPAYVEAAQNVGALCALLAP